MSYEIEVRKVSQEKDGVKRWFTPAEAQDYYRRYGRNGITIHWWGDGGKNSHEQTVAFFERRVDGSVNYVLSNDRITYMVDPVNVAFTSQSGNATTISIECQTYLGDEGYKKLGWLIKELEELFNKPLPLYPHNFWFATQCPGSIDLNRARAEADKWKNGAYNPQTPPPVVVETPKQITLKITDITNKKVKVIRNTNLWDLHFVKYADAKSVKPLTVGTEVEVSAIAEHPTGSKYYLSEYSFARGIGNGINVKDVEDVQAPAPEVKEPPVVTPPKEVQVPVQVPEVTPTPSKKDEEQDKRLSAIEAFIELIKRVLGGK